MKEKILIFLILMKNKRYKALFKLSLFIIFFAVVFIVFDSNPNEDYINNSGNKTSIYDISNYSFNYEVDTMNLNNEMYPSLTLNGYRDDSKYVFEVLEHNSKYYFDKELYTYNNEILPYTGDKFVDLELYSPENIKKYLDSFTLDSTTTFADGQIIKTYITDVISYSELLNENVITLTGDVKITTYEKDNNLLEINIDLLNYNKSRINIKYSNIDKIKKFDKESLLSIED